MTRMVTVLSACLGVLLLLGPSPSNGDPGSATTAEEDNPIENRAASRDWLLGPIDWIRAGVIFGQQDGPGKSFLIMAKLQAFGLDWQHLYFVPLVASVGGYVKEELSTMDSLSTFFGVEPGYLHRWGHDEIRVGLGLGWAVGRFYKKSVSHGVGTRPSLKYRHYWGRFGLEVSVEVPFGVCEVVGITIDNAGYGEGWKFYWEYPMLGVSFGM